MYFTFFFFFFQCLCVNVGHECHFQAWRPDNHHFQEPVLSCQLVDVVSLILAVLYNPSKLAQGAIWVILLPLHPSSITRDGITNVYH